MSQNNPEDKIDNEVKEKELIDKDFKNEAVDIKQGTTLDHQKQKEVETDAKNLYAYLDRDDYTTEKFKIEVRGLPKFYGIGELKKFLNEKLGLSASKIKPPKRGSGWAYICFRSKECQEKAIGALHGTEWKRAKLTAQVNLIFNNIFRIIFQKPIFVFLFSPQIQHQILT